MDEDRDGCEDDEPVIASNIDVQNDSTENNSTSLQRGSEPEEKKEVKLSQGEILE